MIPKEVEAHFTHSNGTYGFARWGRPIAPIVFGVEDATLSVLKGAIEAVVALANHENGGDGSRIGFQSDVLFLSRLVGTACGA